MSALADKEARLGKVIAEVTAQLERVLPVLERLEAAGRRMATLSTRTTHGFETVTAALEGAARSLESYVGTLTDE